VSTMNWMVRLNISIVRLNTSPIIGRPPRTTHSVAIS
jgi:hypothetical protein